MHPYEFYLAFSGNIYLQFLGLGEEFYFIILPSVPWHTNTKTAVKISTNYFNSLNVYSPEHPTYSQDPVLMMK